MATAGWNPEVQPGGASYDGHGWNNAKKATARRGFNWRTQVEIDRLTPEDRELYIEKYALPNPKMREVLAASGISLEEAYKRGLRSSNWFWEDPAFKSFKKKGVPQRHSAGLIIPHYSLNGMLSLQYKPDEPYLLDWQDSATDKPRKYDWEKGAGNGVSVGYNAALRLDTYVGKRLRLIIVEGTRQAICADIYAPDDCIVVGIPGIWNGQSERELQADILNLILRGYIVEIIIIPDGDFKTKPHVWGGAALLAGLITEASGKPVRFASLNEPEGLDDYLGGLPAEYRTERFAALIDNAGDLPPRPSKSGEAGSAATQPEENEWSRFNIHVGVSDLIDSLNLDAELVEDENGRYFAETTVGEARIGRFSDRAEYLYADNDTVAKHFGIEPNKAAGSTKLLIAALGGKAAGGGKAVYRIVKHFDGRYTEAAQWLREHGGDLDELRDAAMVLSIGRAKNSKRKTVHFEDLDEVKQFNTLPVFHNIDLGVHATPAHKLLASNDGNTQMTLTQIREALTDHEGNQK